MLLHTGLEAIQFQGHSKLAKGLTDIFQEVFNLKESLKDRELSTVTRAVKDFMNKKSIPAMKKVVHDTTGLTLVEVTIPKNMVYNYYCSPQIGDKLGLNARIFEEQYSGTGGVEYFKYLCDKYDIRVVTVEDLNKLVSSLDHETGVFRKNTLYDGTKVSMKLMFDPWAGFFIQELGSKFCKPHTAEELAGVCIHEIGHLHACLEHSLDICYKSQLLELASKFFFEHASADEKMKAIQQMAFTMNNNQAANVIDLIRAQQNSSTIGTVAKNSIKTLFNALSVLWLAFYPLYWIGRGLSVRFSEDRISELANSVNKTSDLRTTPDNFRLVERLADQFVSRHGLASAFAMHLEKTMYNVSRLSHTGCGCNSALVWVTAIIPLFVDGILYGQSSYLGDEHDPNRLRIKKLLEDTSAVFKTKMDPDVRDFYIGEYEKLKLLYKNAIGEKYDERGECIYNILEYIVKTPISLIGTGRFEEEYRKLVNKVNNLVNNSLYYRAYKLEQLIKR